MNRIVRSLLFLSTLACGSVFGQTTRPSYQTVGPGIERAVLVTHSAPDAPPMTVWVYRPAASDAKTLPCVLIAASGSTGLNGASLDEDQVEEHLPFAAAGCLVVAYDVDGAITRETHSAGYQAMMAAFMRSEGGLANARAALRLASEGEPRLDVDRLFVAGHGSGANVALLVAADNPRIRAVAAFSPLSGAAHRTSQPILDALDTALPGFRAFLERTDPTGLAGRIKARVMLFHPSDDEIAPVESSRALADALKAAGNPPEWIEPQTGGHVEAMRSVGLEKAATWFAEMAKRIPASQPAGGR